MNKRPEVHTVKHGDGWANRRARSEKVSKVYPTKKEAQQAGRATARRESTEHLIHNRDGKISEKNSYGNDPHLPKG